MPSTACGVRNNLYSEEAQWVPQYTLEDVLRAHAATLRGVDITFNTELVSFEQDDARVVTRLRDVRSGAETEMSSAYLIGADGAGSVVRKAIGATMVGPATALRNYNVVFRAPDLAHRHAHGDAIMYWMVNEDVPSLLGPMDMDGLWYFIATKLPEGLEAKTLDAVDLIRRSTGLLDLEIEIVRTDPWVARQLVADSYGRGRVFLAGDACHLHPPFGGFGMNMGIGDAVDLGWKMASVLRGWGGPDLLASYDTERRPIHERTIAEATINYGAVGNQLVRPGLEDPGPVGQATRREVGDIIQATKLREFKTLGVVLGSHYSGSPLVVSDGSEPPEPHFMLYVPSAHPGCLAPHMWLDDGSSLYDHFGPDFTLLVLSGAAEDAAAIDAAAAACGVPVRIVAPGDPRLVARYGARFALIRPDQHVAWRGDALPADCRDLLARVTGSRLVRAVAAAA